MTDNNGGPYRSPEELSDPVRSVPQLRLRRPWPFVAGMAVIAAVAWSLATGWVGIWGSHPIGWISLLVAAIAGGVLVAWSLIAAVKTDRSTGVRWAARVGLVPGAAVAVLVIWYTRPLSADQVALDALADSGDVIVDDAATTIRLQPAAPLATGLAFYPGAKVDPRAYARVLLPVAEAGYPVVIFKQPFNLAILDSDAADRVVGQTDDVVEHWVIGGHSLGGAMAARYAETSRDELVGLLLHAAFPASDMSDRAGLTVRSISGTEDGLATTAKIDDSVAELPATAEFVRIDGAIHSFFGDYGLQSGDGTPTISRDDAQAAIVAASIDLLDSIDSGR
jgi:hypothetical protein